jgi:DNA gyrase inhibitor GyrI
MADTTLTEREDTPVMFLRAAGGLAGVKEAWEDLEARLGSTRQRKFFGAFEPASGDYRACVPRRVDDDPAALGLEVDVLPGGSYLRARLRGEPPAVYERIGPTFVEMAKSAHGDSSRPSIEFYRRSDEIDLLLPVE